MQWGKWSLFCQVICVYVCVYEFKCVCVCLQKRMCVGNCLHEHVSVCMCVHEQMCVVTLCVCVYEWMCVGTCLYECVCVCVCISAGANEQMCVNTSVPWHLCGYQSTVYCSHFSPSTPWVLNSVVQLGCGQLCPLDHRPSLLASFKRISIRASTRVQETEWGKNK